MTGSTPRILRTSRLPLDEYFLIQAQLVALRSTCARRAVGCVLIDEYNHVLATGYNGGHTGSAHCIEIPCAGANLPPGQGLDVCRAIHAEQNALMQCRDVNDIRRAYVTASPCVTCMRMLANTSVQTIVYAEEYPHPESFEIAETAGIRMVHLKIDFSRMQSL